MTTLGLNYLNYQEQVRSNLAKEAEQHRSNLENEAKNRAALAESIRYNKVLESQKDRELSEKERAAREGESISWSNLSETTTSHRNEEALKSQEIGLKSEDLAELIKYHDATLGISNKQLVNNAWNTFSKEIKDSNLPEPIKTAISLGAATSALKKIEARTITDTAISDILEEFAALVSPEGSEERSTIKETLNNVDANVRSFAYKTVGSVANIADFLTKFIDDYSSGSIFGKAIGDLFRKAADNLRGLTPDNKDLLDKLDELFQKWGDRAESWFRINYDDWKRDADAEGIPMSKYIDIFMNQNKLVEDATKYILEYDSSSGRDYTGGGRSY